MRSKFVQFAVAALLSVAASAASAYPTLTFACTDDDGCQLPLPQGYWFTGGVDAGFIAWEVLIGGLDWHWGGPNSDLISGGSWSSTYDADTNSGILRISFDSGYSGGWAGTGSRTFGFYPSQGPYSTADDFGRWSATLPEPSALALLGLGLAGLAFTRRRKH